MLFLAVTILVSAVLLIVDATPGALSSGLSCPSFGFVLLALLGCTWAVVEYRTLTADEARER